MTELVDSHGDNLRESLARAEARWNVATETAAKAGEPSKRRQYTATIDDRTLEYPISGLNPSTYTTALHDADLGDISSWMELCEEMEDRDGQIGGMLATRRAAVVACDADVVPWRNREAIIHDRDAEPKDEEVADYCRDNLFNLMDFEERRLDLLDANGKGTAYLNTEFDSYPSRSKNRNYYIKALHHVPQRKMTYYNSASGEPRLLTFNNPVEGEPLRYRQEWVIHAPRVRSIEPWRLGLHRILGWYFIFKHADMRNWMKFLETHAHPLRIGVYAPGMSEADKDAIWYALRRMSTDQAALVAQVNEKGESPIKFQWPETKDASDSFLSLLDYCDKEIAKCVLGQTLTSSADGKGSWALGQVHDKVRHQYLAMDADLLAATIKRDLIAPLVYLNYGADYMKRLPSFKIDYELPEDKQKFAQAIGIAAQQAGMTFSKRHIHKKLGTRPPDGPDDVAAFTPPQPSSPFGDKPKPADDKAKMAAAKRPERPPAEEVVEALEMMLPPALAAAIIQYANTVDAWMETATGNIAARLSTRLPRHEGWANAEEFAEEFEGWMQKAWGQYWAAGAMSAGLIAPYLSAIYSHFKASDMSAFPQGAPMDFTVGNADKRFINFLNRSDRFFFSTAINHDSYRGPLKKFLIDEYAKAGGQLFGEKNAALIEKFQKAAGAKAHKLSRYEVDRVIRSTVARGRNWARYGQFVEAGVTHGTVVNGGNPCPYCQDLHGVTFEVAKHVEWIERALDMDDEEFASMLQARTDAHRAAHASGASGAQQLDEAGPVPAHPSCECTITMEIT